MLSRLTIDNYALINHLDITFPGGLVIITGQTGAGKSILLGALSLLLGARADLSVIRDKSRNCIVEAQFNHKGNDLIIRRVLTPSGRSRLFLDDEPVSAQDIRDLSLELVDIHSQNQHLLLGSGDFQLSLLDGYAGLSVRVEEYNGLYDKYREDLKCLRERERSREKSGMEQAYLQDVCDRLVAASLVEGELEELEREHAVLSNCESVKEGFSTALSQFISDNGSIDGNLKEAVASLTRVAQYVPLSGELSERVESARIEIKDIASEIESLMEKVQYSPARLAAVEQRISLLYDLMKKNGVGTVSELIARRDSLLKTLSGAGDDLAEMERLKEAVASEEKRLGELAEEIHRDRVTAAPRLSALLQESVRDLEMPVASLEVRVSGLDDIARNGRDSVCIYFDANGGNPTELSKCASGGEMSRIMLCIKALMCRYSGMPTMFFDEIDTGVSGSIADKMGRLIVGMGESMQVFAITHLPQVASKGCAHYLVYKEGEERPETKIRQIDGPEREKEIARLLSGATLTPEAIANARVLLNDNNL